MIRPKNSLTFQLQISTVPVLANVSPGKPNNDTKGLQKHPENTVALNEKCLNGYFEVIPTVHYIHIRYFFQPLKSWLKKWLLERHLQRTSGAVV